MRTNKPQNEVLLFMTSIQRMVKILDQKGKTMAGLSEFIGVAPNTVTSWKARSDYPPAKYIPAICEYLGVSAGFLLTGQSDVPRLPEEQEEILRLWSKLDDAGRTLVKAKAIEELRRLEG